MRQKRLPGQRDRRGTTLVLVAITMAAIPAVVAALDMGAMAAAEATGAETASCLKPWVCTGPTLP